MMQTTTPPKAVAGWSTTMRQLGGELAHWLTQALLFVTSISSA
jgi:hypothetical protein